MGHNVFRGTAGAVERERLGWGGGLQRRRVEEKGLTGSGGHMSQLPFGAWILQAFVLNIDAEAENKPCPNTRGWVVDW